MKRALRTAAILVVLPAMIPVTGWAQTPSSGFYIGAEGGLNWLLNTNVTTNTSSGEIGRAHV